MEPIKQLEVGASYVLRPLVGGFAYLRVHREVSHIGVKHHQNDADINVGNGQSIYDIAEFNLVHNNMTNISQNGDAHDFPSDDEKLIGPIEINLLM